jgi:hypothetical protein
MKITVGDIKQYFSNYPDDMEVILGKDVWPVADEIRVENPTALQIIKASGLFTPYVIINN